MSDLLDRVLKNKDNPTADQLLSPDDDKTHTLPDGAVVYDSTIAAINRILAINLHLHKRATGVAANPYQLYNGNAPVDLADKKTFLSLLRADFTPKTPFQTAFLIGKVTELAPLLSRDCIVISDGLLWDRNEGILKNFTKADKIRTVS